MAITWQTPGAALVSAASATSIAPAYPTGCVEGDKLLLVVGQRPSTVNSGSVSTPANWNLVASKRASGGYGTTFAADTANTNLYVFERTVPAGGLSGTLTVSVSTNNVCWAQILRLTTSNGSWNSVAGTTGEDVTGGTAVSIACASNPGVTAGDAILTAMCIPTDAHTGFSGYGATQAGVTFGTWARQAYVDSGNGNDIGGFVASSTVSTGTATGNPTITATAAGTTTNVRGPGIFVRVREGALPARTGSMSSTETGTDAASASGDVIVKGSLAVAETGEDTFTASGSVRSGVSGSMAATEIGADAAAASGKVLVKGVLVAAEAGADAASVSGDVFVRGALAASETGQDIATVLGQLLVSGVLSVSETGMDAAAILGVVPVSGTVSAVEAPDAFAASGSVTSPITGAMAATEEGEDTFFGEYTKPQTSRGGVGRIVYAKRKGQRDDEVILAVINKFLEVVQ